MEVSVQLNAPATLSPEKDQGDKWFAESIWKWCQAEKSLVLPGIKHRSLSP